MPKPSLGDRMRAMTFQEFRASLGESAPPEELPALLKALWWDGKDNFDRAHGIAQDDESGEGSWVHAYLHRKEGDSGNAGYWYGRAQRPYPKSTLDEEWQEIATELLERS
jgi:hypothetical protein